MIVGLLIEVGGLRDGAKAIAHFVWLVSEFASVQPQTKENEHLRWRYEATRWHANQRKDRKVVWAFLGLGWWTV